MIKRILVYSDGSPMAEHAAKQGVELAKATGASVIGLALAAPYPLRLYGELMVSGVQTLQHYRQQAGASAQAVLAPLEQAAKAAGIGYTASAVTGSSLAEAIVATAEAQGCDLICMGAQDHRDLLGVHLGKEMERVLTKARMPVLVCH